jgi:hypothetical protein
LADLDPVSNPDPYPFQPNVKLNYTLLTENVNGLLKILKNYDADKKDNNLN